MHRLLPKFLVSKDDEKYNSLCTLIDERLMQIVVNMHTPPGEELNVEDRESSAKIGRKLKDAGYLGGEYWDPIIKKAVSRAIDVVTAGDADKADKKVELYEAVADFIEKASPDNDAVAFERARPGIETAVNALIGSVQQMKRDYDQDKASGKAER
jgi:hypothetical protein